jgi:hypothetical protein
MPDVMQLSGYKAAEERLGQIERPADSETGH